MMFIHGRREIRIASERIHERCSNCGAKNSIQMLGFQKYLHVFWIPLFPLRKRFITRCSHCGKVLQWQEFNNNLNNAYETLKLNTKTPVWTFSGVAIFCVLLVWALERSELTRRKNEKLVSSPLKGHIYEIKKAPGHYTLYKVHKVSGDTVFFLVHKYETDKITRIGGLRNKGDDAYALGTVPIMKSELKHMLEERQIFDIKEE